MSSAHSRREFLTAGLSGPAKPAHRHTVDEANIQAVNADDKQNVKGLGSRNLSDAYLETYKKNAMACEFELLFNLQQYKNAAAASLAAFQTIDELEEQLSVYRKTSELTYVNNHAGTEVVTVEAGLYQLLEQAADLHAKTDRAFDITSWPLSQLWGFSRRQGVVPDADDIAAAIKQVDGGGIELLEHCGVKFKPPQLKINLGGIGKGYALDRVVQQIESEDIDDFVIHGGQSSVVARGSDGDLKNPGWTVGLTHPVQAGQRLAEIRLRDEALGTSGTGRQGFFHKGKRYGHIIDPRTGWPTDHFLSTTVICDSAAQADALATAFFVMQIEDVASYCQAKPDLKAIVVVNDPAARKTRLEVFNMDDSEFTILG